MDTKYDAFIAHAEEDKGEVARPLAEALGQLGISVWYDEHVLRIGDSLNQAIDFGLAHSKFGVLILSLHFFAKRWPQQELAGLRAVAKDLLPVWHNIARDVVADHSPMLADIVALKTDEIDINEIATRIAQKVTDIPQEDERSETRTLPLLRDVILLGAEYDEIGDGIEGWAGDKSVGKSVMQATYYAKALIGEMEDIPFNIRDRRDHIIFGYLEPACHTVLEIAKTNREPTTQISGGPWSRLQDAIVQTNTACADLMNHYGPEWGIFQQAGIVSRPTSAIIRWYADRMYYSLLNVEARLRTT